MTAEALPTPCCGAFRIGGKPFPAGFGHYCNGGVPPQSGGCPNGHTHYGPFDSTTYSPTYMRCRECGMLVGWSEMPPP